VLLATRYREGGRVQDLVIRVRSRRARDAAIDLRALNLEVGYPEVGEFTELLVDHGD
jgi:hypothetical protein